MPSRDIPFFKNLSHVGSKNQTGNLLSLALGIQDAVVVIELVELLGQLVAVVSDTTRVLFSQRQKVVLTLAIRN